MQTKLRYLLLFAVIAIAPQWSGTLPTGSKRRSIRWVLLALR
ncbi:MAG: hypothetical protein ACLRXQ_01325 [Phascolarctobacterium faecium]